VPGSSSPKRRADQLLQTARRVDRHTGPPRRLRSGCSLTRQSVRMKSSTEPRRRFRDDERNGCAPSSKMIRAALNLTSDIVLFFPADVLRFVDVNEAACTALGYSKRALLTMELSEVVAPEARDALASAIRQSDLEPAASIADFITLRRRDGSEFRTSLGFPRALGPFDRSAEPRRVGDPIASGRLSIGTVRRTVGPVPHRPRPFQTDQR